MVSPLPSPSDSPSAPDFERLHPTGDVLVFERSNDTFALVGGTGRGEGWAGNVEVSEHEPSMVSRAWHVGTAVRRADEDAFQVAGPYHARNAVAVPVGARHVVVFGSESPITIGDSDLVRLAAAWVDRTHGVPADKLVADELELVHALRALMAYRPETVRETVRHVAMVASQALSCEIAYIRVVHGEDEIVESIGFDAEDMAPLQEQVIVPPGGVLLEQVNPQAARRLRIQLAAMMTLPLGSDPYIGAIALGHSSERARGFTSLCQRIGRALAEAAELLITQAAARESLAAERDALVRISGTDQLTGIPNRRQWDEEVARMLASRGVREGYVISCDLDGLKMANDRYGHVAGDALIRAAANLLTSCVRAEDLVARIGGDEFAILLRDANAAEARNICARIRRAERVWRVTEHGLTPRLSLGTSPVTQQDAELARQLADAAMYKNKRRRKAVLCPG